MKEIGEIQLATQKDKELCRHIYYYNEHLSMINSTKTPQRISQDIITSSKQTKNAHQLNTEKKLFNLMPDGVHPSRTLAKLVV